MPMSHVSEGQGEEEEKGGGGGGRGMEKAPTLEAVGGGACGHVSRKERRSWGGWMSLFFHDMYIE